ncbi:MAG: hypothetical protein U0L23_01535, partial [Lachnospiraceae bacterium]|nr:hypothetical protein [Lachnospiraceae bacterium]
VKGALDALLSAFDVKEGIELSISELNDTLTPIVKEIEKLKLGDIKKAKYKYFIRFADSVKLDAVKEAFGAVTTVDAGISGEFAVITEEMSQENFEEKIKGFDGVVNTIRTEL